MVDFSLGVVGVAGDVAVLGYNELVLVAYPTQVVQHVVKEFVRAGPVVLTSKPFLDPIHNLLVGMSVEEIQLFSNFIIKGLLLVLRAGVLVLFIRKDRMVAALFFINKLHAKQSQNSIW